MLAAEPATSTSFPATFNAVLRETNITDDAMKGNLQRPDYDKIKGLELTAAGIDEVNELEQNGYLIISSRVGRENHHGEPQFVLATCNPADNWVKDVYTPWVKGTLPDDIRTP